MQATCKIPVISTDVFLLGMPAELLAFVSDKDQTPTETQKRGKRHLYQIQPNVHLSQDLVSASDLWQLCRKEKNIPEFRGTGVFSQILEICGSGTF